MAKTTASWRVRSEEGVGEGRLIDFGQLTQAVADGMLSETAQARGPQDDRWSLIGDHPQLEEFLPRRPLLRSRSTEEAEMDMTPMIDVTFQLIIFFMITATFVVQKTLDMPQAGAADESAPARPTLSQLKETNIIVKVKAGGEISVDDKQVTLATLPDALREAAKDRDSVELVLDVDDDVPHQTLVQVIDGAAGAEIEKIHFVHRVPPAGGSPKD